MNTLLNTLLRLTFRSWRPSLTLAALSLGAACAQQTESRHAPFVGDFSSQYNREIWWMSVPAIIMSALIFLGTSGALFYSVYKFRERRGDGREPSQFHGNNTLEIALIAVPFVIVTVLSVLTARTLARTSNPVPYVQDLKAGAALAHIDVVGAQFWWNFAYPDLGGFRNGNEMVMPAARPVGLTVTALNSIHQFWAPNIGGGQRQMFPGTKTSFFVDSDRPGVYQGNCAQICGASHANMRFKVIVLPDAQWKTFVAGAQAYRAPAPAAGSPAALGLQVFLNGPKAGGAACGGCHRVQGTAAVGAVAPDLSFFGSRYTLGAGMWEGTARERMLRPWLKNSPGVKPGSLMPAYPQLTAQELDGLVAYLHTLKLPQSAQYYNPETKKFIVPEH